MIARPNAAPPSRRSLYIRIGVVAGLTVLFFGLVFSSTIAAFLLSGGAAQFAQPPATVSTAVARYQQWDPQSRVVGTLSAINGADLSVEVPGIVDQIYFQSGDDVKAGAPLMRLRDADEVAKLNTLKAEADLAESTYARDQKQYKAQLISQQEFDQAGANVKSARAAVAQQAAVVAKETVRAPFAGHLGIRLVNVGQYINPGTPVVTLQALDPIDFDFHVPQQLLDRIKIGQAVRVKVDAYPSATFTGKVAAIDPKVDPETRNISVRASLGNPDHKLLPGMYASADIGTGEPARYITLPQSAISYNPYGSVVYRVVPKTANGKTTMVAQQTFVTTGDTRGDQVAVLNGLKDGDVVVTAGQIKLQNGAPVTVNNAIKPADNPNPHPVER